MGRQVRDLNETEGTSFQLLRSQSSVQIDTNAKGQHSYCVKVYADTVAEAIEKAKDAALELDKAFGLPIEQSCVVK